MKKNIFKKAFMCIMMTLAMFLGASGGVMMAAGTVATDSGSSGEADDPGSGMNQGAQGTNGANDGGAASVTNTQQNNPDLIETDLEQTIYELDPYNTVLLTLMHDAKGRQIHNQEFEFYSIGPRIIRTKTVGAVQNGEDRAIVMFEDKGFCMKDDTIRFVGVKGYDVNGNKTNIDLMCIVVDKDSKGYVSVYAKNGPTLKDGGFTLPEIPEGTTVIRMGKSCSESKAQTSRANAAPKSEKGCVQNFMLQIEETKFSKMTSKRVPWDFEDIVEWNMRDYKITKELTYWFGVSGLDRHDANNNENNYSMLGIWWQAGRDLEIGHVVMDAAGDIVWETGADGSEATEKEDGEYYYADGTPGIAKVEIDGTDLVAFCKNAFIGNGGSQTKYLLAGANVVECFDNIKGKQYENKDIVTENDLTIQNFKTSFGIVKLTYQKLFDICGMANAAFLLDKPYLRSVEFMSLNKTALDLIKSGQRNSEGVVLQEVNAVYLQYADCHARVWLAGRTDCYDFVIASAYDKYNQKTVMPPKYGAQNMPAEDRQKNDRKQREELDA